MSRPTMLPDRMPRDDAGLKALAKALGCAKKDLLVLASANDPYNADLPAKRRDAEWFAELWTRFGYTSGVHSRRVHYHASVLHAGEIALPSGDPYENTVACWVVMGNGAVAARDLGIINPTLFDDRRNPKSQVFASRRYDAPEPSWRVLRGDLPLEAAGGWYLPSIRTDLSVFPFDTGYVDVAGYDYDAGDQPYLTELWIEKSTMDDVLVPLCLRLGVNYTPGLGFTSRTRVAEMLQRARAHGKPVRVFVVSDYDPAGSVMPRSIARVIEFYRDQIAPDVDIALHHIGMTRDWAERYQLPRAPIKEDDLRKANFEAVHGEGCVELDALEVLHPGALAREVGSAIGAYRDPDLSAKLTAADRAAKATAAGEWHAITRPVREELAEIHASVNEITRGFQQRLSDLNRELTRDLAPYRDQLAGLWEELVDLADEAKVDLPERPEPAAAGTDESGWLYDSRRHWWDQLRRYRDEKSGGDA